MTNLEFLREIIAHPAYAAGATHTGFIAEHWPDGIVAAPPSDDALIALALAEALGLGAANASGVAGTGGETRASAIAVWHPIGAWRGVTA